MRTCAQESETVSKGQIRTYLEFPGVGVGEKVP